jgi:hypothetical protein
LFIKSLLVKRTPKNPFKEWTTTRKPGSLKK